MDEAVNEKSITERKVTELEEKIEKMEAAMDERCQLFGDELSKINKKFEITRVIFFVIILGVIAIIYGGA